MSFIDVFYPFYPMRSHPGCPYPVMAVITFRTLKQVLQGGDFTRGKLDCTGALKTPMSVGAGR